MILVSFCFGCRLQYFLATTDILHIWAANANKYSQLSRNKIILSISTSSFQILIGLAKPGPLGLVMSNFLGLALSLTLLLFIFINSLSLYRFSFSFSQCISLVRKHKKLSLWTTPGTLINTASQYLPEIVINRLFGPVLLGQYSLAMRILRMPLGFVPLVFRTFFANKLRLNSM